jgi:hypothetical protein
MNIALLSPARATTLSLLLVGLSPRLARAEDSIRYKFQDYREADGRIAVKVNGTTVEKDLGTDTHLKLEGIIDSIAGATPNGQPAEKGSDQVGLSEMHERRKAWNGALSRQIKRVNLSFGFGNSRESDYVSNGWSLNTVTDFNQKNTNLLVGVAGTDDDIRVFYQTDRVKKRSNDVIVGVTQLLDARTSLTFNFTWGRARGYLADPYKLVQKNIEIFPGISLPLTFSENRPAEREKWIALVSLNRAYAAVHGAVDLSYRFYHDSYKADAHTIDAAWFQNVGEHLILRPGLRFHDQSAASFYYYDLDKTAIVPFSGPARANGPFYSSDYRLSALRTVTYGLKVIWTPSESWQLDAAFERYDMRGRDGVTPQSAYCQANILTLGARFGW